MLEQYSRSSVTGYKINAMFLNYLISKIRREEYKVDPKVSKGLIWYTFFDRLRMLIMGVIKHPWKSLSSKIFLGHGSQIVGSGNLEVKGAITLQSGSILNCFSEERCSIGLNFKLGRNSIIVSTTVLSQIGKGFAIGDNVGFNDFCYVGAQGGVRIGSDTIFGPHTSIFSEDHDFSGERSTMRLNAARRQPVSIGSNCWVGAGVTILAGTKIGDNVILAAGAIVKGDIPSNSLVTGYNQIRYNYVEC